MWRTVRCVFKLAQGCSAISPFTTIEEWHPGKVPYTFDVGFHPTEHRSIQTEAEYYPLMQLIMI